MVIADPAAELSALVEGLGDPAPNEAPRHVRDRALLIRRRFGLALPPPFVGAPSAEEPVRVATAFDGAAIAAVKYRTMGTSYRGGILSDRFLDQRGFVPPVAYWVGRAMVPPSRRHRLLVWGRPGTVFGYVECGPAHPDDLEPRTAEDTTAEDATAGDAIESVGEIWELYVDPSAQGAGGGGALISAAEEWLDDAGFDQMELSVLATNSAAQGFYRSHGWEWTGRRIPVDLGSVSFEELRFRRA